MGNHAVPAWNVGLVVVNDKALPDIAAFPFTTMDPGVKPLPKPTPPPPDPIVYAAVPTLLSKKPLLVAYAFTVSVALTVIGALYTGELVVGVVPSVV